MADRIKQMTSLLDTNQKASHYQPIFNVWSINARYSTDINMNAVIYVQQLEALQHRFETQIWVQN